MTIFCFCPDSMVCNHKKWVNKRIIQCRIDADKEKCCYAKTKEEVLAEIKEM